MEEFGCREFSLIFYAYGCSIFTLSFFLSLALCTFIFYVKHFSEDLSSDTQRKQEDLGSTRPTAAGEPEDSGDGGWEDWIKKNWKKVLLWSLVIGFSAFSIWGIYWFWTDYAYYAFIFQGILPQDPKTLIQYLSRVTSEIEDIEKRFLSQGQNPNENQQQLLEKLKAAQQKGESIVGKINKSGESSSET